MTMRRTWLRSWLPEGSEGNAHEHLPGDHDPGEQCDPVDSRGKPAGEM